jgi:hypothetical protein
MNIVTTHITFFQVLSLSMLSSVKIIQCRLWLNECVQSTGVITLTGGKLMYLEEN